MRYVNVNLLRLGYDEVNVVKRARLPLALFLMLALFSAGQAQRSAPASAPVKNPPKLILVLALDQMRFDYLTRFDDLYKGGIRRLIDRGAVFSNANFRHASTETGPGHSVILSGRHPKNSGIVGNQWWDPLLRVKLNVVDDPVQSPVGGSGRGASPSNFVGFTVGDTLKLKTPDSHIVGVSFKDRSAILMAGRRGDAAYWFESDGNFITSTYYASKSPDWLTKWNAQRFPDKYSMRAWSRLLPDQSVYQKYAGRDDMPGEWDGKDITFPHTFQYSPPSRDYYEALRRTPFADELTLAFAIEVMKAHHLGEDDITDIFAVGFSGTDYIGHRWGPESHEALDQLLRLDQVLQQLFNHIDATVGMANTLVVVTADHGAVSLIEGLKEKGIDARRGDRAAVIRALQQAFAARFPGVEGLIADLVIDSQFTLYLDEEVVRKGRLDPHAVEETAAKALMSTGFFEVAYTRAQLLTGKAGDDPYYQLFHNAYSGLRAPNVTFMPKKYVSFAGFGSTHGTAYDYDRHVPIIFMGTGIKAGKYPNDCGPEDIAPTLAKILGFEFPKEPDSRLLSEMLP